MNHTSRTLDTSYLSVLAILALVLAAPAARAQLPPFACNGEAFVSQRDEGTIFQIDQTRRPFEFVEVGATGGEFNNIGFRSTDGLLYGLRLTENGNTGLVRTGNNLGVESLGVPFNGAAQLPDQRFDAGDISADGTTLYINRAGLSPVYHIDLDTLEMTPVPFTGDTGAVHDWAYHPGFPTDFALLVGGDNDDGQVAILDPVNGVRVDLDLVDMGLGVLPRDVAFGGAWFNAAGKLFLYRNNGEIYEIDLDLPNAIQPHIDAIQTDGPSSEHNDATACVQNVIGAAKTMSVRATGSGLAQVEIGFSFENLSSEQSLFNLTAIDDLTRVFGEHGRDWRFVSISSSPASFANRGFDGHSITELVNQTPTQSLFAGEIATITVVVDVLTLAQAIEGTTFCNQIEARAESAAGQLFGDLSTNGLDPDPNGDNSPDERDPSCVQIDPPCNSEPIILQDDSGKLFGEDALNANFADATPTCQLGPGQQVNNAGFRRNDGRVYGIELSNTGNSGLVHIDPSTCELTALGYPTGLSTFELEFKFKKQRFDAGDVSSDGRYLFVNRAGLSTIFYRVDLESADLAAERMTVVGARGFVHDWAYNPADGALYGADDGIQQGLAAGQLAKVAWSETRGRWERSDVDLVDSGDGLLPVGVAFGGAWFNSLGHLVVHRNQPDADGNSLYEIDLSVPTVVSKSPARSSLHNDGTACVPTSPTP